MEKRGRASAGRTGRLATTILVGACRCFFSFLSLSLNDGMVALPPLGLPPSRSAPLPSPPAQVGNGGGLGQTARRNSAANSSNLWEYLNNWLASAENLRMVDTMALF